MSFLLLLISWTLTINNKNYFKTPDVWHNFLFMVHKQEIRNSDKIDIISFMYTKVFCYFNWLSTSGVIFQFFQNVNFTLNISCPPIYFLYISISWRPFYRFGLLFALKKFQNNQHSISIGRFWWWTRYPLVYKL